MRVVVFISTLGDGGPESHCVSLANSLAEHGQEVHFASAAGPLRSKLTRGVVYHHTDNPNHLPIRVAHTISLLLREIRADVIHSHGASCAMVASVARKASKVPCARVASHYSHVFLRAPRWIAGPILKRCADHYIAVTREKQADMESLGIAKEHISFIPDPADVETTIAVYQGLLAAREPNG